MVHQVSKNRESGPNELLYSDKVLNGTWALTFENDRRGILVEFEEIASEIFFKFDETAPYWPHLEFHFEFKGVDELLNDLTGTQVIQKLEIGSGRKAVLHQTKNTRLDQIFNPLDCGTES